MPGLFITREKLYKHDLDVLVKVGQLRQLPNGDYVSANGTLRIITEGGGKRWPDASPPEERVVGMHWANAPFAGVIDEARQFTPEQADYLLNNPGLGDTPLEFPDQDNPLWLDQREPPWGDKR